MRPDDGPPKAEYLWHDEVIRDPVSAKAAIGIAKTANGRGRSRFGFFAARAPMKPNILSISAAIDRRCDGRARLKTCSSFADRWIRPVNSLAPRRLSSANR